MGSFDDDEAAVEGDDVDAGGSESFPMFTFEELEEVLAFGDWCQGGSDLLGAVGDRDVVGFGVGGFVESFKADGLARFDCCFGVDEGRARRLRWVVEEDRQDTSWRRPSRNCNVELLLELPELPL